MTTLIPNREFPMFRADSIFNMMNDFLCDSWTSPNSLTQNNFRMDIQETDENYVIEAELPGVKKEEITLLMEENYLKIGVEQHEETEEREKSYLHRERRHSAMHRSVYLKEASDENIEASLNEGVLSVTIPKKQKDEAHKIEIK